MNFTDSILRSDPRFQDAMRQGANSGSGFGGIRPIRRRRRLLSRLIHIAIALVGAAVVARAALDFSHSSGQAASVGFASFIAILLIERKP